MSQTGCASGKRAVVPDPFAGSGGVAARTEGRGFIGFEKDEQTAKAANKRVGDALVGLTD